MAKRSGVEGQAAELAPIPDEVRELAKARLAAIGRGVSGAEGTEGRGVSGGFPKVLKGWKAICEALGGIDRTTARRWEQTLGLPIKRPSPGIPMLWVKDLDAWKEAIGK